jgi:basic membrane protein A
MLAAFATGCLALWAPSASAQSGSQIEFRNIERDSLNEAYQVAVRALNFRAGPSLDTPPVSIVQQGDFLLQTGKTFNQDEGIEWMKAVRGDGLEGWVSSRYVSPVSDAIATVEDAAAFLASLSPAAALPVLPPITKIRAGFVYISTVGDAGWTYQQDLARQSLAELPFVESTSYIESVPEDDDLVEAAIDELVDEGNNLIFTTSYGFMDATIAAAKRHPDVVFMHNSGYKTAANAGNYFGRMFEARYLSGIIAGAMTESNVIGYVAAFPIPEVIRGINAFTLGAQSVNPDAKVELRWTKTWYGPGIEREKAEELLDQGADVLAIHQDSPAVIQLAEQRGKYAIGYHSDMAPFGPNATLTSAIWDWDVIYKQIALEMREGVWEPDQIWWGLEKGVVALAPISDQVPAETKALVEERRDAIANRRLRVFEGPILDTAGDVRVPSGTVLSDADLLTMDFYVQGVEGGLASSVSTVSDATEVN